MGNIFHGLYLKGAICKIWTEFIIYILEHVSVKQQCRCYVKNIYVQ